MMSAEDGVAGVVEDYRDYIKEEKPGGELGRVAEGVRGFIR